MTQFQFRWALCVVLLIVGSQTAAAGLAPIRQKDPLSIMGEFSVAGPNGTAALNVSYDLSEWLGVTAGGGVSLGSRAFLTSLMLDTRVFRNGDVRRESALMVSLGSSYRGPSKTVSGPGMFNDIREETTASSTFYLNAAIGYAYAARSGTRIKFYMGWNYPLQYSDHKTERFDVSYDSPKFEGYSKPTPSRFGYPSIGLAYGSAF